MLKTTAQEIGGYGKSRRHYMRFPDFCGQWLVCNTQYAQEWSGWVEYRHWYDAASYFEHSLKTEKTKKKEGPPVSFIYLDEDANLLFTIYF